MRRALGLGTGSGQHAPQQRPDQARARHRFVQDGGVPVVMLSQKAEPETAALRERIASLESALEHERQAHASVVRTLKEQESHATALQTRLAHADLAHREALEVERRMRVAAQEALQEALAAAPARRSRAVSAANSAHAAEPAAEPSPDLDEHTPASPDAIPLDAAASENAPAPLDDVAVTAPEQAAALEIPPQQKRGRGRPRSTTPPEPKPVRWWTPGYRAKPKS